MLYICQSKSMLKTVHHAICKADHSLSPTQTEPQDAVQADHRYYSSVSCSANQQFLDIWALNLNARSCAWTDSTVSGQLQGSTTHCQRLCFGEAHPAEDQIESKFLHCVAEGRFGWASRTHLRTYSSLGVKRPDRPTPEILGAGLLICIVS